MEGGGVREEGGWEGGWGGGGDVLYVCTSNEIR